jgi:hypothetical protein
VAARGFTFATIRVALGERLLEMAGGAEGTTGTDMFGEAGGGTLAALPMPLGSLIELLTPPTLPGPWGIPLTPASCARDFIGALKLYTNAKAKKADLPNIGHSPVKRSNESAGFPFLVWMPPVKRPRPRGWPTRQCPRSAVARNPLLPD